MTPKIANERMIAFFISSGFNVVNEFSQHYKGQYRDYSYCYMILENIYIIHTFFPGIAIQ